MHLTHRPIGLGAFVAILLILLALLLMAPPRAAAEIVGNAAGRYDTLVLRDLGAKQAALVQLVSEAGAFTERELWRSKKGALDIRKATFVAGDVDGNGIADGIVLYDLGGGRSRLQIYPSDGFKATQVTAWTSKPKAFARAKAKLAVGDLDRDGRDDLLALYDRGRARVALYRFVSTGSRFTQSLTFSARSGLAWSKAQLAAGDVTGDGRSDGLVLYAATASKAQLLVFSGTGATFSKQTFWSGAYAAGRARLAAGDVDSDGDVDAVCLYRRPATAAGSTSSSPPARPSMRRAVWYEPGATPVPTTSRFGVGDVNGDGRADALTAAAAGAQTRVTSWVSSGSGFAPEVWLAGPWAYAKVSLGVAPSVGLVVSDKAEPLQRRLDAVPARGRGRRHPGLRRRDGPARPPAGGRRAARRRRPRVPRRPLPQGRLGRREEWRGRRRDRPGRAVRRDRRGRDRLPPAHHRRRPARRRYQVAGRAHRPRQDLAPHLPGRPRGR